MRAYATSGLRLHRGGRGHEAESAAVRGGSMTRLKTTMKRMTPAPVHDDDEADGAGGHAWRLNDDVADEAHSAGPRSETMMRRTALVVVRDDDEADGAGGRV